MRLSLHVIRQRRFVHHRKGQGVSSVEEMDVKTSLHLPEPAEVPHNSAHRRAAPPTALISKTPTTAV
jgi:hypothetical protein